MHCAPRPEQQPQGWTNSGWGSKCLIKTSETISAPGQIPSRYKRPRSCPELSPAGCWAAAPRALLTPPGAQHPSLHSSLKKQKQRGKKKKKRCLNKECISYLERLSICNPYFVSVSFRPILMLNSLSTSRTKAMAPESGFMYSRKESFTTSHLYGHSKQVTCISHILVFKTWARKKKLIKGKSASFQASANHLSERGKRSTKRQNFFLGVWSRVWFSRAEKCLFYELG